MEGLLEIKDSTSTTQEPVKTESPVRSPNSERSDEATSPPPNCSICLGKLINTSFTDSCLHQFCFNCLLQWSKIKTECPLCKQTFKSIIHSVRSEEDYDQCPVAPELASQISQPQVMATLVSSSLSFDIDGNWDVPLPRFFYRTTMGNRQSRPSLNSEQIGRREQLSNTPQVSREERRRRRNNPEDYRRMVYSRGIWATSLPDMYGHFRECSADYYRRQPAELNRLVPWLNRELQVLLNHNPSHVAYIMTVIMDALTQYDIRSSEFRDLLRRYFGVHTDHFVYELLNYARTSFDLVDYDRVVTYLPAGLSNEYVPRVISPTSSSSSTTSDDSDVRVLDEAIDLRVNAELPGVGPHSINMPGPSTVGQAFQLETSYNVPDILTISSNSSSSDDECEVIGYVKPRHERTPEIIELVSSDPENTNVSHVPSDNVESVTMNIRHTQQLLSSSSVATSDTYSDSDFSARRSRRYQSHVKKSLKKDTTLRRRKGSSSTRSYNRGRNRSSSAESGSRKRRNKKSSQHSSKAKLSSTSDYSSQEMEKKKADEKKSRKKKRSTRDVTRVHKNLIKRERKYNDDSSSSDSSSESEGSVESDGSETYKYQLQRKPKRKYSTSSSDFDTERNEKISRNKKKIKQPLSTIAQELIKKELRYKRLSRPRSSSESSYVSQKDKKSSSKQRDSQKDTNAHSSQDDSNLINKNLLKREHKFKAKTLQSTSESEQDRFRSSSQCSNHSSKSYVHWRRSKHKDRHKEKERKRSSSKTYNTSYSNSNATSSVISTSSKTDTRSSSKHSDSKTTSSSKERYKSRKNHKESKHKRSQDDPKSKSKKKRRRILSSSSSNSE